MGKPGWSRCVPNGRQYRVRLRNSPGFDRRATGAENIRVRTMHKLCDELCPKLSHGRDWRGAWNSRAPAGNDGRSRSARVRIVGCPLRLAPGQVEQDAQSLRWTTVSARPQGARGIQGIHY